MKDLFTASEKLLIYRSSTTLTYLFHNNNESFI